MEHELMVVRAEAEHEVHETRYALSAVAAKLKADNELLSANMAATAQSEYALQCLLDQIEATKHATEEVNAKSHRLRMEAQAAHGGSGAAVSEAAWRVHGQAQEDALGLRLEAEELR